MARIRSIKPEFFANDELALLGPVSQLLFIGLWGLADREGRLEDRPLRIKAHVFPYYEADVNQLLVSLEESGFVRRYCCDGVRVIQVVNFTKHQYPNVKEPQSHLPPPPDHSAGTMPAPVGNSAGTMSAEHLMGREGIGNGTGGEQGTEGEGSGEGDAPSAPPDPGDPPVEFKSRPRAVPRQLPQDWRPDPDDIDWATRVPVAADDTALGLPADFVRSETLRFIDYWVGEGKPKANWTATWRGWMRREAQEGRGARASPRRQNGSRADPRQELYDDLLSIAQGGAT